MGRVPEAEKVEDELAPGGERLGRPHVVVDLRRIAALRKSGRVLGNDLPRDGTQQRHGAASRS